MDPDTTPPPARDALRPLRYLWRVPLLLLHIVLGVLLCAGILSWNQQRVMVERARAVRAPDDPLVVAVLVRIFGLRAVRVGEPLADPVLFVANHTRGSTSSCCTASASMCFVAKAEIARWPLVGWMAATRRHHLPPPRQQRIRSAAVMQRDGGAAARRPVGGGVSRKAAPAPRRRVKHVPCAHLPGRAGCRGAGAAGGAALRAARPRGLVDAVPRRRKFPANFLRLLGEAADGCGGAFPRAGAVAGADGAPPDGRAGARAHRRRAGSRAGMSAAARQGFPSAAGRCAAATCRRCLSSSGVRRLLLPRRRAALVLRAPSTVWSMAAMACA